MNYPYWKDRCSAEASRRHQGPEALLRGDQGVQVGRLPAGRREVQGRAEDLGQAPRTHQPYRRDDLNKKDTGLVVKRYARACQQSQIEMPPDTPFQDLIKAFENDNTKDPFDALEMLDSTSRARRGRRSLVQVKNPARLVLVTNESRRGGRRRPPRFALGPPWPSAGLPTISLVRESPRRSDPVRDRERPLPIRARTEEPMTHHAPPSVGPSGSGTAPTPTTPSCSTP